MKAKAAIKKIKNHFKKQGIDIEIHHPTDNRGKFWFQHGENIGSFLLNGHDGFSAGWEDAHAINWHRRRENDHSDLQSGYYAGSFRSNCGQLCESMLPSPPKFPVGSLVRGKETKRAIRYGFSGKVGLVMSTDGA